MANKTKQNKTSGKCVFCIVNILYGGASVNVYHNEAACFG